MQTVGAYYHSLLQNETLNPFDLRELFIQQLFLHSHSDFYLHLNDPFQPSDTFFSGIKRLRQQEPIAYIVGSSEFYHRRFDVDPSVLIPRPETEELVELVLKSTSTWTEPLNVIDIGTGSGVIACTLKRSKPLWNIGASDLSEKALFIAKKNAKKMKLKIDFRIGSGVEPWLTSTIHGVVSNPPYILDKNTIDSNVLMYEPHLALLTDEKNVLYRPILELFVTHPELKFVAFECLPDWKAWFESFLQTLPIALSLRFIEDINSKVRFAWIERK